MTDLSCNHSIIPGGLVSEKGHRTHRASAACRQRHGDPFWFKAKRGPVIGQPAAFGVEPKQKKRGACRQRYGTHILVQGGIGMEPHFGSS
eukprot:3251966-Amphidinium_carterae.1